MKITHPLVCLPTGLIRKVRRTTIYALDYQGKRTDVRSFVKDKKYCHFCPGNITFIFYRPQRSCGKVKFSLVSVCLFVCLFTLGMDILMWPPSLAIRHATPSFSPFFASDIWWPSLDTCSNLFAWGPQWYWHLVTEARSVRKRAVRILLEGFLV